MTRTTHSAATTTREESPFSPTCRICGQQGDLRPWHGIECDGCGSVTAARLPTQTELTEFYREFTKHYHGGGRRSGARERQLRYARAYRELVGTYVPSGAVLDIGSANNPLPNVLRAAGYVVTAADFARPDGLDAEVGFVLLDLDDDGVLERETGREAFDAVTAFAVIEHCLDPHAWVRDMVATVRPGGYLVLTTPEIGAFGDRFAPGRSRWFCPPEHLHLISSRAMDRLFGDAGCEPVLHRRFELNALRWCARYGILLVEGVLGAALRAVLPRAWRHLRDTRVARGQGIACFVYRRRTVSGAQT